MMISIFSNARHLAAQRLIRAWIKRGYRCEITPASSSSNREKGWYYLEKTQIVRKLGEK